MSTPPVEGVSDDYYFDDTVSGLSDNAADEFDDHSVGAADMCDDIADWPETWVEADDGEMAYGPVSYRQPTTWQILKRQGIRAAVNYKCERLCMRVICHMHADARKHGYNLVRPDYRTPWRFWWFKLVSKLEFYTRPRKKKYGHAAGRTRDP